jgi:phosphoribosylaminoimidazole carboxylase PurE protein
LPSIVRAEQEFAGSFGGRKAMMSVAKAPLVGVMMGSDSDLPVMEEVLSILETYEVEYEVRILSAHRSPEETSRYAATAAERGLKVLIAGAGWAAHLAGVVAAHTILPVIGVPIDSSPLQGMDALLATVQMPPGIPVATMAIGKGGARNAAIHAVQILALQQPGLAEKLKANKRKMAEEVVVGKNQRLQEHLSKRKLG